MNKKVLMILGNHFPPDIRVYNEAKSLVDKGFPVTLICYRRSGQKREEDIDGITVKRIASPLFRLINYFVTHLVNVDPFLVFAIKKELKNDYSVMHVNDLLLLNTALLARSNKKIKLLVDLHENFPESLKSWYQKKRLYHRLMRYVLFNHDLWRHRELVLLKKVDFIFVVSSAHQSLLIKDGIDKNIIKVIPNAFPINFFKKYSRFKIKNKNKKEFKILYIGGFGPHRGLDTTIRSIPYFKEFIPNVKVALIGANNKYSKYLYELAKEKKVLKYLQILPWRPFHYVASYIKGSDICLVPHNRTIHTENAVPHKLFQYMYYRKPIVASDCKSVKNIIQKTGSG